MFGNDFQSFFSHGIDTILLHIAFISWCTVDDVKRFFAEFQEKLDKSFDNEKEREYWNVELAAIRTAGARVLTLWSKEEIGGTGWKTGEKKYSLYIYVYVCVCIYVCICACAYVYTCVCIRVCVCMCSHRVMGTCVSSTQGLWELLGLWEPHTGSHNLFGLNLFKKTKNVRKLIFDEDPTNDIYKKLRIKCKKCEFDYGNFEM